MPSSGMTYFVDIHIETPPGDSPAVIRLGPEFESLDDANAAAADYITELGLPPGGAHYRVVGKDGAEVVSTEE